MSETKNLCAAIPIELHTKVRKIQVERGITLHQYVGDLIREYYEMKEGKDMSQTRTLALQIPEELFTEIKVYLKKNKLTQKDFIIGIIKKAIASDEVAEETQAESATVEPNANEQTTE